MAELAACLRVYRTYLPNGHEHLDRAYDEARTRRPDLAEPLRDAWQMLVEPELAVALRFQQTTGAVMAKGVEDRAFYRTSRLTSLTEVGGDPSEWSLTVEEFHLAMAKRQREWPHAMTTTSTHDTKRGEDVRARIAVLAELPEVWAAVARPAARAGTVPDPGFGNLLWQAVVGAWPAARERLHGVRREGDARGRRPYDVDRTRRVVRGRRPCRRRRGVRRPRGACGARRARRPGRRPRLEQLPLRQAPGADHAGRARRLPGQRAVGAEPGRPRQPPAGRLRRRGGGAAARVLRPASGPSSPRARTTAATRSCSSPRRRSTLRRSQPAPLHDVPARRAPRAHAAGARARLRPRRGDHRGDPAARRPRRARRWGDTVLDLPGVSGPTCSQAARSVRRLDDILARAPAWRCWCVDQLVGEGSRERRTRAVRRLGARAAPRPAR